MKRVLFLIVGLLMISCSIQSVDRQLEISVNEFNTAFETANVSTLKAMITEDYVHTNSSWKSFGKETWLTYVNERAKKIQDGSLTIHTYFMDEIDIRHHGTAAIVTGRISVDGTENGMHFSKQFRVTQLWILEHERWLRAGFHDTPVQ